MFIKREYNRWYYSTFTEKQKERVRQWRLKQRTVTNNDKPKKTKPPITIQYGNFVLYFN